MKPQFHRFHFRRTAALIAAAASLLISHNASALSVTLTNTTGSSCTYSGMSVDPTGNVQVTCTAAGGTGPGTLSITAPLTMTVGVGGSATVTRSGGNTLAATVVVASSTPSICTVSSAPLTFPDGGVTSFTVPVATPAAGTCTLTLSQATIAAISTGTANITVAAATTTPPPPPPPSGCATAPSDMLSAQFLDLGVWWAQLNKSQQVVSIPLTRVLTYSKQAVFGENAGAAYTPQPVTLEITISKCPGFIDVDAAHPSATHPNGNACNLKSPNGTYNSITWFGKPYGGITTVSQFNAYGYCYAPESDGQYYLNARWTFSSCPLGQQVCGFAIQQNRGPY
jgi:hypothetical protein